MMSAASPLDSASHWLTWSNGLYVGGAAMTLATAMLVFYEKRAIAAGKRVRGFLFTEILVFFAALVSLCGTIGAVHFGNVVSHLKDSDLAAYEKQADVKIAAANQATEELKVANSTLQTQLATIQTKSEKAEAKLEKADVALAAQNAQTIKFAQALQLQQQNMAEQMHVSPVLNDAQIQALATLLKPFTGQDVIFHSTADTTVLRLKAGIAMALNAAGLTFKQNAIDIGSLYQGVSVVVHSPQDVPPLANSLIMGLRDAGIVVRPVALDSVPPGRVALYLGPN